MNEIKYITNKCPSCSVGMDIDTSLIGTLVHCRECNANFLAPSTGIVEGTVVDDIWFHKKIGSSIRSDVFVAKLMPSGKRVAIKVLSPVLKLKLEQLQAFVARFKAPELREHQTIVAYTAAGSALDHLYVMADFLDVEDLKAQLRRVGTLPEGKLLHVTSQVAEALDFSWQKYHVCHGTIKPANLMMESSRRLRIPELGLYNLLARQGNRPNANDTEDRAYASPEQEGGGLADFRSDMYALGATLYHLATGAKPLSPTQARELMGDNSNGGPLFPDANEINPKLSADFAAFLNRLLSLDPQQRPSSWNAVQDNVEALMNRVAAGTETQEICVPRPQTEVGRAVSPDSQAAVEEVDTELSRAVETPADLGKKRKAGGEVVKPARKHRKIDRRRRLLAGALRNRDESSPRWVVPFLLGCLIVLIAVFGYIGINHYRSQIASGEQDEAAEAAAKAKQQEKLDNLDRKFNDALEFARNNPRNLSGAIERFTEIRNQGVGTPYQKLAHQQILILRQRQRRNTSQSNSSP